MDEYLGEWVGEVGIYWVGGGDGVDDWEVVVVVGEEEVEFGVGECGY